MKRISKGKLTRRDRCYLVARRASRLTHREASWAWMHLCSLLASFGQEERIRLPKFNELLDAIRTATVQGRRVADANYWVERDPR